MRVSLKFKTAGLALILWALSAVSFADHAGNLRFDQLSVEDGLSQSYVYDITQDQQGFMWFGTQEGINRFDGYDFEIFTRDVNIPDSLPAPITRAIEFDDSGQVWVGNKAGLSTFTEDRRGFVTHLPDPGEELGTNSMSVRSLLFDAENGLWVGTDARGLFLFDVDRLLFSPVGFSQSTSDEPLQIWSIVKSSSGHLLVATSQGLLQLSSGSEELIRYPAVTVGRDICHSAAKAVIEDSKRRVWIGLESQGLCRIDPDGEIYVYRGQDNNSHGLASDDITALLEDSNGAVWVGTARGLSRFDERRDSFDTFRHRSEVPTSLGNDWVLSLYEDDGGVLWVGTNKGLSSWSTATVELRNYRADPMKKGGLPSNAILGFAQSVPYEIYVATADAGIAILDLQSSQFRSFNAWLASLQQSATPKVTSLVVDASETLWIGTHNSGLISHKPSGGTTRQYVHQSDDSKSISSNGIAVLHIDQRKQLWVSTYGSGIDRYDPATDQFFHWRHSEGDQTSLSTDSVMSISEDRDGTIWFGHYEGGVDRLSFATGLIERIGNGTVLDSASVMLAHQSDDGDLWFVTERQGIFRWPLAKRQVDAREFEHVDSSSLNTPLRVYSAVVDQDGAIWMGTISGLVRFRPSGLEFDWLNSSHGLTNTEYTFGAALFGKDGRLYFGGDNGFSVFPDELVEGSGFRPPLVITGIRRLDEWLDVDQFETDDQELVLTHKDYLLEIRLAALDFFGAERSEYIHRLEGFQEDWVDAGTQRIVSYTSLPAGNYTFQAKARNSFGDESANQIRLKIRVLPAPWLSWWAFLSYALAAVVLGAVFFRAHAARLRQNAAEEHASAVEHINSSLTNEITVRKEKEAALEKEKERAETYFNVAEVVLLTLNAKGDIIRINSKGASMFGEEPEALSGSSWLERVAPDWRETVQSELLGLLGKARDTGQDYFEFPLIGSDEQEYMVAWNCTTLLDENDERILFCSGMDVTRVRSLEKQMRIREKMNAIGTLAGGIAHDFNNILQAIYGFTTLALETVDPADEKATYLGQVVKGADRARNLVKRILTFSNQKEYDLKSMDLEPVILEAGALLRGSLPATVEIEIDIDEDRIPVRADPTRVHQVVMNLGTNAGQAMGERGGKLKIHVRKVEFEAKDLSEQSRLRPGPHMLISVADTGSGMTAKTLEHIFDPFFTTKETSENTGLGLTVVHGIVQSHGGDIEVSSTPGIGTEFRVYFPSSDSSVALGIEALGDSQRGSERILVVDDEEWVLAVTGKLLQGQGYQVQTCNTGERATTIVRHDPKQFDLLITDETMPKMTGSQLVEKVREAGAVFPILIISGKLAPEAVEAEGVSFLQKPFTTEEISAKIREIIADTDTG